VTVSTEAVARRYALGRHESRSLLGRRERGEVVVLVLGVAVGVVASLLTGGSPVGFVLLAASLLGSVGAIYLPWRGRTLYQWLPIDLRFAWQRRTGSASYTAHAREAGIVLDTGVEVDVPAPAAVGRLKWLAQPYGGAELAVLAQLDDGSLLSVLEIEGPGVGLFDGPDQEGMVARWGAVLRDLANSEGFVSRIGLLERCVPTDPQAHSRYVAEFNGVRVPEQLKASYDELHDRVGAVSEQHRNYVVVRMSGDRALAKAAKLAGGGDEGLGAVMLREVEALAARLEDAGIKVLHGLGPRRTAALLASLYNPDRPIDDTAAMTPRNAWPRSTRNAREHLEVNDGDWFHATAWVKTWPLVPVGVNFLAPLLVQTPGVIRTVAVTMDLIPTDVAMTAAMSDLTTDAANSSAAAKAGRTADPRDDRQLSQAELRAYDIAQGAGGVRAVGYVTVSARSPEELEMAKRRIRTAGARSWLSLEWCDKEHDRAFVNTLPLVRGLR
jgi:hypothetical protein